MRRSRHIIVLLTLSLLALAICQADEPKPSMLTPERQKLAAEADALFGKGMEFYQQGKPAETLEHFQQGLSLLRQAFPRSEYPDGHADLALGLNNLGFILQSIGRFETARPYFEETLVMQQKLFPASVFPNGHTRLANSFNNMGYLLLMMGAFEQARPQLERALAMQERLYPTAMYPAGHPDLVSTNSNVGGLLLEMGLYEKALPYFERSLAMSRKLYAESVYPNGHLQIANATSNVGNLLRRMGTLDKALPYFEQSLTMQQKLYPAATFPDGHPNLAFSLNNLGLLLTELRLLEKARLYHEQAASMYQKLYPESKFPEGHPDVALTQHNLGSVLQRVGLAKEGRAHLERAVAIRRQIYPLAKFANGHPLLASSIYNFGLVLYDLGSLPEARQHFEQALAMTRKLYPATAFPHGHQELAQNLCHLAQLHYVIGSAASSLEYFNEGLAMHGALVDEFIATTSEENSLAMVRFRSVAHSNYLSATLQVAGSDAAAYRVSWDAKAGITRVLEKRHANARAAGTEQADKLARLRDLRRQTDRLLRDGRLKPDERDRLLSAISDEREKLERDLAAVLPMLSRWNERDRLGPDDLTRALPAGAVFVDLIAYNYSRVEARPNAGPIAKPIPSYTAFVLAAGQPPKRVELGEARLIDEAIAAWRTAIDTRQDAPPIELARRVWEPIAKQLPAGARRLYLSPAGNLARIPWAALAGSKPNSVLLEDWEGGIAVVPHGSFLLEQLKYPPKYDRPDSTLVVGGIGYGKSSWPPLPGTQTELKSVSQLAPREAQSLSAADATVDRFLGTIPQVRYAHLATHGFYDADALTAEYRREWEHLTRWTFQEGQATQRLTAARNPLGFVGLVLSDGEVLSGLRLVDLPLENLKLVTLSACETGLGVYTGGEGVQNLQMAFHLAGCPNVVASLWKVNDAATAALMVKFYHELWVIKKPPIAALREAQLTIYRRPDLIPALAAERGLKLEKALESASTQAAPADKGTAPTKLWAAFVLSGVGS